MDFFSMLFLKMSASVFLLKLLVMHIFVYWAPKIRLVKGNN